MMVIYIKKHLNNYDDDDYDDDDDDYDDNGKA